MCVQGVPVTPLWQLMLKQGCGTMRLPFCPAARRHHAGGASLVSAELSCDVFLLLFCTTLSVLAVGRAGPWQAQQLITTELTQYRCC